jgi:hypothetical protein
MGRLKRLRCERMRRARSVRSPDPGVRLTQPATITRQSPKFADSPAACLSGHLRFDFDMMKPGLRSRRAWPPRQPSTDMERRRCWRDLLRAWLQRHLGKYPCRMRRTPLRRSAMNGNPTTPKRWACRPASTAYLDVPGVAPLALDQRGRQEAGRGRA